ncbi:MAG TPA: phage holin family protein [Bryobacteraceae bacterium]|jgi:uncharacterized membrane protein|nr:phage holin family protein [Bryobacteraceae bacterium]
MAGEVNRPMGAILHDVAEDVAAMVRSEIKLAKTELSSQVKQISEALPMLISGAVFGFCALGLLLTTGVLAIGLVLPFWAAAAILFGVTAIIAAVLLSVGKSMLGKLHGPERTVQTLKENAEWVKSQAK